MNIILGPLLGFGGKRNGNWVVSVLIVFDSNETPLPLIWTDGQDTFSVDTPERLKQNKTRTAWRYELTVPQNRTEKRISYGFDDDPHWTFVVPPESGSPNMLFASCNGFSDPKKMKKVEDKNALWKDVTNRHNSPDFGSYHLLLMGGDQIYSDTIWEVVSSLKKWSEKNRTRRRKASFTRKMREQVESFYFNLYVDRWAQEEVAEAFASIPSVMMWDDHDVFDGWGSYDVKDQFSAVFQGIFEQARDHFSVFQQHLVPGGQHAAALPGQTGYTLAHDLGETCILALDLRSERTKRVVMSPRTWGALVEWLKNPPNGTVGTKHLLVMSSIPVVHPDFSLVESLLGVLPGRQELEDDLRDHWFSRAHKGERLRLIHRLLKYAVEKNVRVTILSGDVHVAALGVIESRRDEHTGSNARIINQLTSSAIVHPAPSALELLALETVSREPDDAEPRILTEMLNFPGTRRKLIGARNWLSLEPDSNGHIWANWFVEGEQLPYTKVVHTV